MGVVMKYLFYSLFLCLTLGSNSHATLPVLNSKETNTFIAMQEENKTEKQFILDSIETDRKISELTSSSGGDFAGQWEWRELSISYILKLEDGSVANLAVLWDSGGPNYQLMINRSSLNDMYSTFHLKPGDEIAFLPIHNGGMWTQALGNFVHFSLIRDGVTMGTYQGWFKVINSP
jgi:hypothetical protein